MSLDQKHPSYLKRLPDWEMLSHCFEGERAVKEHGTRYLPPTAGMIANGMPAHAGERGEVIGLGIEPVQRFHGSPGAAAYNAYRMRAVYHDFLRETINGLLGVIHRKDPVIEVPTALEPLVESATIAGESLKLLWRRITMAQLLHGRGALLVDVPNGLSVADSLPYIALYGAPTVINWDAGQRRQGREALELIVLDESEWERAADLSWQFIRQLRILSLTGIDNALGRQDQESVAAGQYQVAVIRQGVSETGAFNAVTAPFVTPSIAGKPLDRIPFVFFNPNDLTPDPDVPPLLGLANLSLAIYRAEADYRQTLYMQGQDTLVVIGATPEQAKVMTGVGSIIDLVIGGDAKFIGVSAAGISEQRQSLENDIAKASSNAVQMLDTAKSGGKAESGEALRVRVAARTATLASMQLTAAQAVKDAIELAGRWMGLSDAELAKIVVEPNLDFADQPVDPLDLSNLADAVVKGFPLSLESLHGWARDRDFTGMEFDEEMEKIAAEKTDGLRPGGGVAAGEIDPTATDGQQAAAGQGGKPPLGPVPPGGAQAGKGAAA